MKKNLLLVVLLSFASAGLEAQTIWNGDGFFGQSVTPAHFTDICIGVLHANSGLFDATYDQCQLPLTGIGIGRVLSQPVVASETAAMGDIVIR